MSQSKCFDTDDIATVVIVCAVDVDGVNAAAAVAYSCLSWCQLLCCYFLPLSIVVVATYTVDAAPTAIVGV